MKLILSALAGPLTSKMPGMDPANETVLMSPGLVSVQFRISSVLKENQTIWLKENLPCGAFRSARRKR